MRKNCRSSIFVFVLVTSFISLGAQPCGVETPPTKFPWASDVCPSYLQMGKSQWIPEALKEYQAGLVSSQVVSKPILKLINDNIVLVQYSYHFKLKDYSPHHEFYYLVEESKNLLLWKCGTFEYPHGALEEIRLRKVAGKNILEFEFFTGGTAGYWEEYYEIENSQLYPIKEIYTKEADFLIPKGYSIRRVRADIEKLTACIYLAKSDDGNCCPSGRLDLKLTLLDHALHLKSGHFSENK